MDELGLTAAILPELHALRGVQQNRYHHADVHGHTLEVLARTVALQADPAAVFGDEHAAALRSLLAEPLADDVDRGLALRLGALLHDAAKPATLDHREDGTPTFLGHDRAGAQLARDVLTRLRASERLKAHVAALVRHHLRLGFLVHERPLSRRALYRYLTTCEPVEVDVTLLSVADRLATRGRKANESIAAHVELAREVLPEALAWRAQGRRRPLVRGDRVASELRITDGPEIGRLLAAIDEAAFAGEVSTGDEALALAARLHEQATGA
jgi:putative nucleotidyltransferase with HDIG domain